MKLLSAAILLIFLLSLDTSAQLKSRMDKISYSIGVNLANNLKRQDVKFSLEALLKGVKDAATDTKLEMTDQEMQDTLMSFQKENMAAQADRAKKQGEENTKKGDAFLEANKKKEGVIALPDGLQYKILKAGAGKSPTLEDSVTVNYKGALIDGTEFDSSYKRGQAATFTLSGVIKGWQEAMQLMKPGSKWEIYIPPALGYGERGYSSVIPPNSVLIFDVELISFK